MGMGWCTRKLFSRETLRSVSKYELRTRTLISGNKHLRRNPNPGKIQNPYIPYQLKMGFSGSSLLSSSQTPNTILLKNLVPGRRYYKGLNFPNLKPKNSWKLWVKLIAVFVGSCTAYYLYNQEIIPYTNRPHFVYMSTEREKLRLNTIFEQLKKGILKGKILPADHPKTVRVNSIAENLIKALQDGISQTDPDFASYDQFKLETKRAVLIWKRGRSQPEIRHLEDLNWEIIVIDSSMPDVLCIPGGKIIVCDAVLEHFETDDEIATFIAHQVGHLVARHLLERVTNEMIETEANYIGLMLMASAGYDPSVAMITYEKLGNLAHNLPNKLCMMRSEVLSQTHAMSKAMKLYAVKKQIDKSEDRNRSKLHRFDVDGFSRFHLEYTTT
ncbi:hypothetical protein V2J09_001816 [Rumex salicifolius]